MSNLTYSKTAIIRFHSGNPGLQKLSLKILICILQETLLASTFAGINVRLVKLRVS
jgi:hypothetical protein